MVEKPKCAHPGCGAVLRNKRNTGFCHKHYYKSTQAKRLRAAMRAGWGPEQRAAQKAAHDRWLADPENRASHRAKAKAWTAAHPEWRRSKLRNYRAKKTEAGGRVSVQEWLAVLEAFGHRCAWCASPDKLEMDHIHPVSLGGATVIQNVQPLCGPCNKSKGTCVLGYRP